MNVIDSHVHLYPERDIEKETNVSREPVQDLLYKLSEKIADKKIDQALIYTLDKDLYSAEITDVPDNLILSTTLDINKPYRQALKKAVTKGIKIVKLLPYIQNIPRSKYPDIVAAAKFAKENNMVFAICSSYGSKLLYETNGVELAAFVRKKVDIPIILAHGGAVRVFDALTMMSEYEDIFIDLSFSLKYWWGSSVIKDYAFAIKKINSERCFYGSDYPYVGFDESLEYFMRFVNEYNFSDKERDSMLYSNFGEFKRRYL